VIKPLDGNSLDVEATNLPSVVTGRAQAASDGKVGDAVVGLVGKIGSVCLPSLSGEEIQPGKGLGSPALCPLVRIFREELLNSVTVQRKY
jgi:hypothetical protein